MPKTEIVLLSPLPPPAGGIASWTKLYLEWTRQKNVNVTHIDTALIGKRSNNIHLKRNFLTEIIRTAKMTRNISRALSTGSDKIIHLNTSCGKLGILRDYLLAYLVSKQRAKLVVHYHCNIGDQVKEGTIQLFFLRKLAKISNINLVLNEQSNKFLNYTCYVKSKIFPNFIDDEFILPYRRRVNRTIERVVFVGHVHQQKGVTEIISVAKKFRDMEFLLVGPISKNVDKNKFGGNITYVGQVEQSKVREVLLDSDVFLFPTHSEGFSMALLEAMAMGLPVITTNVGANQEMIGNKGGIILDVADISGIINALQTLRDANLRQEFSDWNLERVKEYSTNKVLNQLNLIYEALQNKPSIS